jgi:integrase
MGTMKMALKLVLLTLVENRIHTRRGKSGFQERTWTIPADRMKASAHVIYLPKQAQDLLVGLQMCAGGSEYLVPGRYNFRKPLSNAALNSLIDRTVEAINKDGEKIQDFTVHDLRRTASTLLHEADYPSDWIEKAQAHEQKGVRRGVQQGGVCPAAPICCSSGQIWLMPGLTGSTPIWCRSPRRSLKVDGNNIRLFRLMYRCK